MLIEEIYKKNINLFIYKIYFIYGNDIYIKNIIKNKIINNIYLYYNKNIRKIIIYVISYNDLNEFINKLNYYLFDLLTLIIIYINIKLNKKYIINIFKNLNNINKYKFLIILNDDLNINNIIKDNKCLYINCNLNTINKFNKYINLYINSNNIIIKNNFIKIWLFYIYKNNIFFILNILKLYVNDINKLKFINNYFDINFNGIIYSILIKNSFLLNITFNMLKEYYYYNILSFFLFLENCLDIIFYYKYINNLKYKNFFYNKNYFFDDLIQKLIIEYSKNIDNMLIEYIINKLFLIKINLKNYKEYNKFYLNILWNKIYIILNIMILNNKDYVKY